MDFSPEVRVQIQQEYLEWHDRKYGQHAAEEKELAMSRAFQTNSAEDKLRQISKKLQNVVAKMELNFDPIKMKFLDDSGKLVSSVEVDIGKL
jgi:hypothetical protein